MKTHAKWTVVLGGLILVAGLAGKAWAVAAEAKPQTLKQPNGKSFLAQQWGDEWRHGWETDQGYGIVKAPDGYWVYLERSARGQFVATSVRADQAPPARLSPHLRAPAGPGPADLQTEETEPVVPPNGTAKVPVVLINYNNTTATYTTTNFNNLLFGTNPAEATGPGSMRQYYEQTSYGVFGIAAGTSGVTGWYTAANAHDYYGERWGRDRARALAREAVVAADATVDFAQYDNDSDGYVDIVMVVHQGRGMEESGASTDIWSHRSSFTPYETNDGVIVRDYTIMPEKYGTSNQTAIGVFCHEFGHALGLPDLYDTDGSSEGIGKWGVMGSGSWCYTVRSGDCPSHFSAWSKYKLGWLTPTVVSGSLIAEPIHQASSNADVYILRRNYNGVDWVFYEHYGLGEYFLIENRQKTGFDQGLPGAGLAIWHVAEYASWYNDANANEAGIRLVDLKDADGLNQLDLKINRGDAGDVWPGTANKRTFNDASTPNAILYDGSTLACAVTNIGNSANPMTANFSCPDSDGDGLPDSLEGPACVSEADPDTDHDSLCDGPKSLLVICAAGEDLNRNGVVDPGETDPCDPDTDHGGEPDGQEVYYGRNPLNPADDVRPASYNATYQCPRCANSSSPCDVPQALINCRDGIAAPEPNQPNTINQSCADGNQGVCPGDESIDRIFITDQTNNAFQPNDQVQVDVTVYCYTGVLDVMYIYHSNSTAPVDWTEVAGPIACPAGGVYTLTAYFNLGPAGGDQVIRVNFGYDTQPGACYNNGWIDHDDVIIPVVSLCVDADGDGYGLDCALGPDCDDGDSHVNPGQTEVPCNAKDDDCNAGTPDDWDGDADGLSYCNEIIHGTSDANPDSDHDGVNDGPEVNNYSTNPLAWDSDGDLLPDRFEIDHLAHPGDPLNPNDNADGPADFDGDKNPNVHEYWNDSDPWTVDPVPDPFQNPACYYWAEGDGDGVPGPGDLSTVKDKVASGLPTYANVLPQGIFDTQDLDKDGVPGPGDISSVQNLVIGVDWPSGYPSSPVSLGVVSAPSGAVAVGDTCHVTLEVVNQALAVTRSGAFAVVYWIDPASTGNAVLLGGDGQDLGQAFDNRFDVSGVSALGGKANLVLKVTAPGPILLRAMVPACGTQPTGRWCAQVALAAPVSINP